MIEYLKHNTFNPSEARKMILTPHMLIGAAIGSRLPGYGSIFALSIILHYLLDALPHREYQIENLKNGLNKKFLIDGLKVALDFFFALGLIVWLTYDRTNFSYILTGCLSAALPDLLIFLFWRFDGKFLKALDEFHHQIHRPKNKKTPWWLGVSTQIIAGLVAVFILYL